MRDSTVAPPDIFTGWNNHFDYNTYYLGDVNGRNFQWNDQERTRSEWQGYGNDIHGTFLPIGAGTATTTVSIASPSNGAAISGRRCATGPTYVASRRDRRRQHARDRLGTGARSPLLPASWR